MHIHAETLYKQSKILNSEYTSANQTESSKLILCLFLLNSKAKIYVSELYLMPEQIKCLAAHLFTAVGGLSSLLSELLVSG